MEFDFAANQSVDAIDVVPEPFRGAYVERDGAFHIADTHKPFTDLAAGLAKSLKASREDVKRAKASNVDLAPLTEFGATPTEIAEKIKTQLADLNEKVSKGMKIDPEKLRLEIKTGFDQQLTAKDQEIQGMQATLHRHLVASEAVRAIAAAKGVPELLMPHINSQVKVLRDGQEYKVAVVDRDGDARISSVTGQPMSIVDLISEMKSNSVFGRAFESEAPAGGGARPAAQGRPQPARMATGELSPLQQIEAGLNAGLARTR